MLPYTLQPKSLQGARVGKCVKKKPTHLFLFSTRLEPKYPACIIHPCDKSGAGRAEDARGTPNLIYHQVY